MASLAEDTKKFNEKFNTAIDQKLEAVTGQEVEKLERAVAAEIRKMRARFWPVFAHQLTRNLAVFRDKKGRPEINVVGRQTIYFGSSGAREGVSWAGLKQNYMDSKQKFGPKASYFFVRTGELKAKLQSYTISETTTAKSFGDKFTRVFGPVKVIVGKKRFNKMATRRGGPVFNKVDVTVIPFSRFPTLPAKSELGVDFERQVFQMGPSGYDAKLFAKLTNLGKKKASRPALVPYTRWWLRVSAQSAVRKAIEQMRKKSGVQP